MSVCTIVFLALFGCDEGGRRAKNDNAIVVADRFPGVSAAQFGLLMAVKDSLCVPADMGEEVKNYTEKTAGGKCWIPMPTWLPSGFVLEKLVTNVGRNVVADSMRLALIYTRNTTGGKKQIFMLEAGFEFGDVLYTDPIRLQSKIGKIDLYYEPEVEIDSVSDGLAKKMPNFVITDWIGNDTLNYPLYTYISTDKIDHYQYRGGDVANFEMISVDDTRRILASMEQL